MVNKFFDFDIGFDEKPKGKKHRNLSNIKITLANYFCEVCDYEIMLPIPKGKKKHLCPKCKIPLTRELF